MNDDGSLVRWARHAQIAGWIGFTAAVVAYGIAVARSADPSGITEGYLIGLISGASLVVIMVGFAFRSVFADRRPPP